MQARSKACSGCAMHKRPHLLRGQQIINQVTEGTVEGSGKSG